MSSVNSSVVATAAGSSTTTNSGAFATKNHTSDDTSNRNRMTYSKDFLLQYSHLKKKDPALVERVTPYLSSSSSSSSSSDNRSALSSSSKTVLRKPTPKTANGSQGVPATAPLGAVSFASGGPGSPSFSPDSPYNARHQLHSSGGAAVQSSVHPTSPTGTSSNYSITTRLSNFTSPPLRGKLSFSPNGGESHPSKAESTKSTRLPLSAATTGAVPPAGHSQRSPHQHGSYQKENFVNSLASLSFSSPKSPRTTKLPTSFAPSSPPTPSYRLSSKSSPPVPFTPTHPPTTPYSPRATLSSPAIPYTPQPALKAKSPVVANTPTAILSSVTPVNSPGKSDSTSTDDSPSSPSKSPFRSSPRPISPLDEQRLLQRQKQIDYGYRTVGYVRYRLLVAKEQRKPEHPRTPKKNQGCSKRSWDGQLKKWRRDLHLWDPDCVDAFRAVLDSELVIHITKENPELEEIIRIVKDKMDNPMGKEDEESIASSVVRGKAEAGEDKEGSNQEEEQEEDEEQQEEDENEEGCSRLNDSKFHKVARTLVFLKKPLSSYQSFDDWLVASRGVYYILPRWRHIGWQAGRLVVGVGR